MQDYERIVRPKIEKREDFINQFPNDNLHIESNFYQIPVDIHITVPVAIDDYVYSFDDDENGKSDVLFRSKLIPGDTTIWVHEYRSEDWHVYVRLQRYLREEFKGLIIKWKSNKNIHNSKINWNIDELTDTIYSTLPKEVIFRELPKFKGIYKYLPVKLINIFEKQVINRTDSMHYNIEFMQ